MRFPQVCRGAMLAFVAVGFSSPQLVLAIEISNVRLVDLSAGNNFFTDTGSQLAEFRTALTRTGAGGTAPDVVGQVVTASTLMNSIKRADSDISSARSNDRDFNYHVIFDVSANQNTTFEITVHTRLHGSLTAVVDRTGDVSGSLSTSAVFGRAIINGAATSLDLDAVAALPTIPNGTPAGTVYDIPIDFSNSTTITGLNGTYSGTNEIRLEFNMESDMSSGAGGRFIGFSGPDDAIRLGLAQTPSGLMPGTAGEYPGAGNRDISLDGHFVTIEARVLSVVPEVSPFTLLGMGMAAFGLAQFFRRPNHSAESSRTSPSSPLPTPLRSLG